MRKVFAFFALLALPGFVQAATLEDLLVEKGVITKSEAHAAHHAGGKVYWNNGTRLDFPDQGFSAKINTLLQPRYTFSDGDGDIGDSNSSSFAVNTARLRVSGNALGDEFNYLLEVDFLGDTGASGASSPNLLDAVIQWNTKGDTHIRAGQFKTGVSRQFNTHQANLQFADRSLTSDTFSLGRQQGAAAGIDLMDGRLALEAQLLNGFSAGEGQNRAGNDTKHAGIATARYALQGDIDSSVEGDVGWTEDIAIDIGSSVAFAESNVPIGEVDLFTFAADFNVKNKGWSLHGEFFLSEVDYSGTTPDSDPIGFYLQGGYFVKPKKTEIAVRYGFVDCDDGVVPAGRTCSRGDAGQVDDANEVAVSLNHYWWEHHLKAQIGYTFINRDLATNIGAEDDTSSSAWTLQLSGWF